jgi:DNA-binding NarL/FixJ family response regulator
VTIRVLIVDDQPLIRSALRALLDTADGVTVVGDAGDGRAALASVGTLRPDVVLMDIRMPGLDGIEATALIRKAYPGSAVVVLTTFDLDEYVFGAVRAGAAGFLLKDGDADDLVRGIRAAAAGDALMNPAALRRLLDEFARTPTADADSAALLAALTSRERDVLRLAAEGLSNGEIAVALSISEGTVKTHIGSILSKTSSRDRVQAVITAYRGGLAAPTQA